MGIVSAGSALDTESQGCEIYIEAVLGRDFGGGFFVGIKLRNAYE